MNYTNGKNANYPESYWRLGWYQIDRSNRMANVRFDCYFNHAARTASPEANVLECKHYKISGDDFSGVFETESDVRESVYEYAQNCVEGTPPDIGEPDTRVSFFATAILV